MTAGNFRKVVVGVMIDIVVVGFIFHAKCCVQNMHPNPDLFGFVDHDLSSGKRREERVYFSSPQLFNPKAMMCRGVSGRFPGFPLLWVPSRLAQGGTVAGLSTGLLPRILPGSGITVAGTAPDYNTGFPFKKTNR